MSRKSFSVQTICGRRRLLSSAALLRWQMMKITESGEPSFLLADQRLAELAVMVRRCITSQENAPQNLTAFESEWFQAVQWCLSLENGLPTS